MKNVENRACRFIGCLTFYDGNEFKTFFEISEGTLAYEIRGEAKKQINQIYGVSSFQRMLLKH